MSKLKLSHRIIIFNVLVNAVFVTLFSWWNIHYVSGSWPVWGYVAVAGIQLAAVFQASWWFVAKNIPTAYSRTAVRSKGHRDFQKVVAELKEQVTECSKTSQDISVDASITQQTIQMIDHLRQLCDSFLELVDDYERDHPRQDESVAHTNTPIK